MCGKAFKYPDGEAVNPTFLRERGGEHSCSTSHRFRRPHTVLGDRLTVCGESSSLQAALRSGYDIHITASRGSPDSVTGSDVYITPRLRSLA